MKKKEHNYRRIVKQPRGASIRKIQTIFYADYAATQIVHTNLAVHANNAVHHAEDHLKFEHYSYAYKKAVLAEVFDCETSEVHAIIKMDYKGNLNIIFKRPVQENK